MQFLFGLDFTGYDWDSALEGFWETNPARPSVRQYAEHLVAGVFEHLDALDGAVAEALHHWNPNRVGRVERAILRIAIFEMSHQDDVPQNVAINEAIEIAKGFGTEDSARFVNGVLDRIKKIRGECDGPPNAEE